MEHTQELDINHYFHLLQKKRHIAALAAYFIITAVFVASYLMKPLYEATTMVSIEKSALEDIIKKIGTPQTNDDKVKALSTIMKSRTLVFKIINDLGFDLTKMSEAQIEGLIKATQDRTDIKIEFSRASKKDIDFFTVSFRHRSPQIARDYVNALVSVYIEENLHTKREGSFGANRFLLDQIKQYEEKVNTLQVEISQVSKDQNLSNYDTLAELQKRHNDLLITYTESHPEVIRIKGQIASLKSKATGSGRSLAGASHLKNRIVALEGELNTNKKIFDELTAAYGRSEMSAQADIQDRTGTFRIVDPAVLPVKPVSPNRIKIMLLGILAGIAGGVGLVVVLDMLDQSIKSADSIKGLSIPVLSIIPHIETAEELNNTKKKDFLLYGLSSVFTVIIVLVMVLELRQ